ncbi:MAG: hypothetical protein DRP79_08115 [Planctomycetota bacterium]|nr:MAG: hypothetical protein DRP79_08115 [Planctomycetota bacterium]
MPIPVQTTFPDPGFLGIFGLIVLIGVGLLLPALIWAIVWGLVGSGGGAVPLPGVTLAVMEFFRPVIRRVFGALFRDPDRLDRTCIMLHNQLEFPAYAAVPVEKRVVILPQCLRHPDCPARISSTEGIMCKECGKCVICRIREIDRRIRVFISPGGTFAKRLLVSQQPAAVLGVACPNDLIQGLRATARLGIPAQGVALTKTGCVETEVDFELVKERLLACSAEVAVKSRVPIS